MGRYLRAAFFFAPAAAQHGGTVEIGLVGKWTRFDQSFSNGGQAVTGWGAIARLGLFLIGATALRRAVS